EPVFADAVGINPQRFSSVSRSGGLTLSSRPSGNVLSGDKNGFSNNVVPVLFSHANFWPCRPASQKRVHDRRRVVVDGELITIANLDQGIERRRCLSFKYGLLGPPSPGLLVA